MQADTVSNVNGANPVGASLAQLLDYQAGAIEKKLAGLASVAVLLRPATSCETIDAVEFLGDELDQLGCRYRDWLAEVRAAVGASDATDPKPADDAPASA